MDDDAHGKGDRLLMVGSASPPRARMKGAQRPSATHTPGHKGSPGARRRLQAARNLRNHPISTAIGFVGRLLVISGLLLLGFVAYTLVGTNYYEAQDQRGLRQFAPKPQPAEAAAPAQGGPPAPRLPEAGKAVAVIQIPKIGVDKAIVEGVKVNDLKKGPGHYPHAPLPGQPGNAAIAGHRTTYGAPFFRVGELAPGDEIFTTTAQGQFTYRVDRVFPVKPTQVEVVAPTEINILTLTTCHPKFSAAQRLVVQATLMGPTVPGVPASERPTMEDSATPDPDGNLVGGQESGPEVVGATGDPSALRPGLVWAALAAAVLVTMWIVGWAWRRIPVYLVGALPFLYLLWWAYVYLARTVPG